MAVSNSFKVSFRLARTREKAGKIKLSLSIIVEKIKKLSFYYNKK